MKPPNSNLQFFLCVLLCVSASLRYIQSARADVGDGKVVALDHYYNYQLNPQGEQFHYIWADKKNSGYSQFGDVWKHYGATLAKVDHAPTRQDLDQYSVYIICNPCNAVKAANHDPHYIEEPSIDDIASWVNDGGVLAMFANDEKVGGCEYVHLDHLAQKFGITFNDDVRNLVPSAAHRDPGTFDASLFPDEPLFKGVRMIYMKEICTLEVTDPAKVLLVAPKQNGAAGTDIIMAVSHYGKGLVFAVGDPWFYNEYIDVGTKPGKNTENLPIDNRKAAENLAQWLLSAAAAPLKPAANP
jgi:unsaturated rhamnogalacturonyl hydrolase